MDAELQHRGLSALRRERASAVRQHRAYLRLIDATINRLSDGPRAYHRVQAEAAPCEHADRRIVARGMCNPCYQRWYYRNRRQRGA